MIPMKLKMKLIKCKTVKLNLSNIKLLQTMKIHIKFRSYAPYSHKKERPQGPLKRIPKGLH